MFLFEYEVLHNYLMKVISMYTHYTGFFLKKKMPKKNDLIYIWNTGNSNYLWMSYGISNLVLNPLYNPRMNFKL